MLRLLYTLHQIALIQKYEFSNISWEGLTESPQRPLSLLDLGLGPRFGLHPQFFSGVSRTRFRFRYRAFLSSDGYGIDHDSPNQFISSQQMRQMKLCLPPTSNSWLRSTQSIIQGAKHLAKVRLTKCLYTPLSVLKIESYELPQNSLNRYMNTAKKRFCFWRTPPRSSAEFQNLAKLKFLIPII